MNKQTHEMKSEKQLTASDFLPDNFRSRITPQILKSQVIPNVDSSVKEYKIENRKIVKSCAKKYVRANIAEHGLFKFMMGAIKYEHMDFMMNDDVSYTLVDYEESEYITDVFSKNIEKNQRWFNDLMLYLSGKYTDGQLLNAEFFRVIDNPRAKHEFIENTKRIDLLNNYRARCSLRVLNETVGAIDKSVRETGKQR